MMKIGLNTNTFPGETLDVLIPMAKDFGIKYFELWGSNLESNGKPAVNFYAFSDKDLDKAKSRSKTPVWSWARSLPALAWTPR